MKNYDKNFRIIKNFKIVFLKVISNHSKKYKVLFMNN